MEAQEQDPKEGPEIMKPEKDSVHRWVAPIIAIVFYMIIKYGIIRGEVDFWVSLLLIFGCVVVANLLVAAYQRSRG